MGRPRKELNWDQVNKLCSIMCTAEEIAAWFNMSVDTLSRRTREQFDCTFADYIKEQSVDAKSSLRRAQLKSAMSGNVTMMIWLGKQYLGQSEKNITSHEVKDDKLIINIGRTGKEQK